MLVEKENYDKTEKRASDNDRNFSFGDLSLPQTAFTPSSGLRNHRDNCYCLRWPLSDHHQRRKGKGGKERNGDVFRPRRWWWWFCLMMIVACFLPSHHLEGGQGSCWSSSSLIADVILYISQASLAMTGWILTIKNTGKEWMVNVRRSRKRAPIHFHSFSLCPCMQ